MVEYDVPEGSITPQPPDSVASTKPLIDFDSLSGYIIPTRQLYGNLVTITAGEYKVMGFPVLLEDAKYKRNTFTFNVCFVFERIAETSSYESVVRKLARALTSLEVVK